MAQSLEELKAENEAEEEAAQEIEETPTTDEEVDEVVEDEEPELDKDGEPVKDKPLEDWQKTSEDEGEGDGEDYTVPGSTHVQMKTKLKGRVSDRDDEIATLKAENEELKKGNRLPQQTEDLPKRPIADDFDDDEAYHLALDGYDKALVAAEYDRREAEKGVKRQQQQAVEKVTKDVDSHYERADKLITESGISPEVYKKADTNVREALETMRPGWGDSIADSFISILGEGSEKVMYFLGNNKPALDRAKALLVEDQAGFKLAAYLGAQKERLTNPKRKTSQARKPSSNPKGDAAGTKTGGKLHREYKKAHKDGDGQAAFNAKKAAKAAGVDVSTW